MLLILMIFSFHQITLFLLIPIFYLMFPLIPPTIALFHTIRQMYIITRTEPTCRILLSLPHLSPHTLIQVLLTTTRILFLICPLFHVILFPLLMFIPLSHTNPIILTASLSIRNFRIIISLLPFLHNMCITFRP